MATQQKPLLRFINILIIIITVVANPLIIVLSTDIHHHHGTVFDLIHIDRLPGRQHLTQAERVKQMLHRDMIHMQMILQNNHHHNKQQQQQQKVGVGPTVIRRQITQQYSNKAAAMTRMISGSDYGAGEYYLELTIGSPAQKFLVIANTGNDLTWLDCNYTSSRRRRSHEKHGPVFFDADNSISFKTVKCGSSTCTNDLSNHFDILNCPRSKLPCAYNINYGDEFTGAQGIFAYETVTFGLTDGTNRSHKHTLIGCTKSRRGLDSIFGTGANGIMGLSNSNFSLQNQASELFGQKFSYCLVGIFSDNTTSSKLFFGSPPPHLTPQINGSMQSTGLELEKAGILYGVYVQNISIGGKPMEIPAATWEFSNNSGGSVIDSGTTLTYLVDSAYGPVMKALNNSISSQFNVASAPKDSPFELCYNMSSLTDDNDSRVPNMAIHFVGGARLVVPGNNYLLYVGEDVSCLAFAKGAYNVIGNMLQQKNLWVFDTKSARLSFGSSSCTSFPNY